MAVRRDVHQVIENVGGEAEVYKEPLSRDEGLAGKTLHISRFALSLRAVIRYCLRMYSWALSDAAPTERCAGHCKNGVSKSLSTMHHARTVSCLPRRYIPKHRIHTAMLAQISIDKVTCSGCSLGMVGSILCKIELNLNSLGRHVPSYQ